MACDFHLVPKLKVLHITAMQNKYPPWVSLQLLLHVRKRNCILILCEGTSSKVIGVLECLSIHSIGIVNTNDTFRSDFAEERGMKAMYILKVEDSYAENAVIVNYLVDKFTATYWLKFHQDFLDWMWYLDCRNRGPVNFRRSIEVASNVFSLLFKQNFQGSFSNASERKPVYLKKMSTLDN